MPTFVPNSYGSPLREFNPCHDPRTGQFAGKGQGNCGPLGQLDSDVGGRSYIGSRALRARIAAHIDEGGSVDAALDLAGPEFKERYRALMAKAPAAHKEMTDALAEIADAVGGVVVPYAKITEPGRIRASMGTIKGGKRIVEKAVIDTFGDLAQVRDVVRSSIAVDHPAEIPKVLNALRMSLHVVREKDRFTQPVEGYRDYLLNVRMRNGLVGEVQVHVKPMLHAKETQGHKLYEQLRKIRDWSDPAAKALTSRMAALYTSAWGAFLAAAALGRAGGRFT